jgi:hypothetical protein
VRAVARGELASAVTVAPIFEVRVCFGGGGGGTTMTSVDYADYISFRGGTGSGRRDGGAEPRV